MKKKSKNGWKENNHVVNKIINNSICSILKGKKKQLLRKQKTLNTRIDRL